MASWLMRLKYMTQKCSLYSYVIMRAHMEQHQGQLPSIGKLVRTLNKIVQHEKSYMTYLQPSLLRDESVKPTIRGMKDEWVLYRFLLLPTWDSVSVGDIVGFRVDPTRVSAASASSASASPASASPASASPASASPASASPASASPASASPASASPASPSAAASPAAAGAEPASYGSQATAKAKAVKAKEAPSFESTQKASTEGSDSKGSDSKGSDSKCSDSKCSDSEGAAKATASRSSFPVIFRRVAAIPGDEMVSSQSSDEPFRIEKDQFWVLADNPAVPVKEALDSRTLGPVHVRDMVGRALYVPHSATPVAQLLDLLWLVEHLRDTFLSNEQDLPFHLRTSEARFRAAMPDEDHFLARCPTELTIALLGKELLAAETSIVAVGASRGDPRTPFFEGCSPSPLLPSVASAAAAPSLTQSRPHPRTAP
ncbi:unnamed protein product [Closterium sp. NIES-53]